MIPTTFIIKNALITNHIKSLPKHMLLACRVNKRCGIKMFDRYYLCAIYNIIFLYTTTITPDSIMQTIVVNLSNTAAPRFNLNDQ